MNGIFLRRLARLARTWGPALAVLAAIFTVSHTPAPPLAGHVPDYWAHMAVYALLALVILRGLAGGRRPGVTGARLLLAALLAAAYGITDEYHQSFVPGRDPSARDVAADAAGAVAGAGAGWVWSIVFAGRRQTTPPQDDPERFHHVGSPRS